MNEKAIKVIVYLVAIFVGLPIALALVMGAWCQVFELFGISAGLCKIL